MAETVAILAIFWAAGFPARGQESLERAAAELAQKLAPDGPAGKVAEAARTEAGRRALAEALREAVAWKIRPVERDPDGFFETWFFIRDEEGTLRPRPERAAEFDALRRSLERARTAFAEFNAKADAFAARIVETGELDRRIKAAWMDPAFRQAAFADLVRESEAEESPVDRIESALRRDTAGMLHVREDRSEEIHELTDEIFGRLVRGAPYEAEYVACVDRHADAETQRVLTSEFGRVFARARMGRSEDEDGNPLKRMLVKYGLVDGEAAALARLRKDVEEGRRVLRDIQARLTRIAGALSEEGQAGKKLKAFLSEEASQAALAEDLVAASYESVDPVERYFNDVAANFFEPRGTGLAYRATGEDGKPVSLNDLDRELRERVSDIGGETFRDMAERCADPGVAELLAAPLAVPALERCRDRLIEAFVEEVAGQAVPAFVRRYLSETGDRYAWRPDRTAKAEAIVARAREIAKEMEQEASDAETSRTEGYKEKEEDN